MCEENPPVRFCAFTADDVGRVTSCQGADGDRVLARCVDGVDGKNQVVAANAVGMITSSIPCASLRPKVSLKILQYGEAVFIGYDSLIQDRCDGLIQDHLLSDRCVVTV